MKVIHTSKKSQVKFEILKFLVNRPHNFDKLVAGYGFIIGDQQTQIVKSEKGDRLEIFHEGLMIYRDKEGDHITNQVLDVKK